MCKKKLADGKITKEASKKQGVKLAIALISVVGAGIAGCVIVDKIIRQNADKYSQKTQENWIKLNEKEKTNVIKSGLDDQRKQMTFERGGYKVNAANYLTALCSVMMNPDVSENELPIFINKEYYDEIRKNEGPLSKTEESQAVRYLDAYNIYPNKVGLKEALTPKNEYKTNLLEKDASKA